MLAQILHLLFSIVAKINFIYYALNIVFCPECGKAVGIRGAGSHPPPRRTHPILSILLLALVAVVLHIFFLGVSAGSNKNDIPGINLIFTITYLILFFAFLGTLFRRPKATAPSILQKKRSGFTTGIIVAIVLILGALIFFNYAPGGFVSPALNTLLVFCLLVLFIIFIRRLIKAHQKSYLRFFNNVFKTVKFLIHHPKLTIFSIIVCVVLILFIHSTFVKSNYQSLEQKLPALQDNLAEAATAKLMGDSIMAGRGVLNMGMAKIAKNTQTTSSNLKQLPTSGMLQSYKTAAIDWTNSIAKAAANTTTWKNLSEKPPDFELNLNDSKVAAYVNTSLQKAASLKQAGDLAIKRKDRPTMYYIAGQLLIQEHWINGLYYSNNPGLLSFLKNIKLVSPVMAKYTGYTPVVRKGPRCITFSAKGAYVPKICPQGYQPEPISFSQIMHAAVAYAAAEPEAGEQWDKEWTADELKIELPPAEPYTETQGGIYNGEPNLPPQLSQAEKVFVDECQAKAGTTGGTGGVYARMPTTESGIACHHGNGCWDYLTRSSRRYSGGNPGCPEENLNPPPPPPTATPRPPTKAPVKNPTTSPNKPQSPNRPQPTSRPSASWDGAYNSQMGGSCSLQNIGSYSGVYPTQVTVRNNRVYNHLGASAPIDSSGNATINSSVSAGGYSAEYNQTFHFYHSGGRAAVSGNVGLPGINGVCSITFSGTR